MVKDFFAFLGMVFLILLVLIGIAAMALFYDRIGIITLPAELKEFATELIPSGDISVRDVGVGEPEWRNPLEDIPTLVATEIPPATETPVPPLDPTVYETEVILTLKDFVDAVEHWLALNEALTNENDLLSDPTWQSEVSLTLNRITETSRRMADTGPAPEEYRLIDQWLGRVDQEAQGLRERYLLAIETQADPTTSAEHFTAASDHFVRVKEYLYQAVEAMIAAGWSF